jgi:hypothetical protein
LLSWIYAIREKRITIFWKMVNQLKSDLKNLNRPRVTTHNHATRPLTAKKTITGTVNTAAPSFFLSIWRNKSHARNQAACAGVGSGNGGTGAGAGAGSGFDGDHGQLKEKLDIIYSQMVVNLRYRRRSVR